MFLSANSSEACTSSDHFFPFFLSLDFHELWCSATSPCLFTEVEAAMGYISIWVGAHFSALLVTLMALWLMLVYQNLFGLVFFFFFFLGGGSLDFHELWHSMMSTCLITDVQRQ